MRIQRGTSVATHSGTQKAELRSSADRWRVPGGHDSGGRYMPAMSFSTRSSTERNGSLHSTVRCAWSFSFRCTQSTVKSRRRSCARRMNSPRSRALRGLRRDRLGREDVQVPAHPLDRAALLQQVVQAAAAVHVVVGQVELGDPRRGERQVVLGPVPLDQLELGDPVDLPRHQARSPVSTARSVRSHSSSTRVVIGVGALARGEVHAPWPGTPAGCPAR